MFFYLFFQIILPFNLKEDIEGFKKVSYKNYNTKNIFDYINGAGEIYVSFKFKNLFVFEYKKEKNELVVEIFEFSKPEHSLGIFKHLKGSGEEVFGIGEEAEAFGNYLIFWKGRYFTSIGAKNNISKEVLKNFAKEIEKNIKKEEIKSWALDYVKNKKIKNFKYFFNMNILNYYYYFINEDIFYFNRGTEGIFYEEKNGLILLLFFENEKLCEVASTNLKEKFYFGDFEIKEIEKNKWSGFIKKEKILKIFLDFKKKDDLLRAINENR